MYQLHKQLESDTIRVGQSAFCDVLLMNDQRYPWLILVPRQAGLREIYDLSESDQQRLIHESSFVAKTMAALFSAAKMNIAALGNMVEQLHVHHVARFITDPVWPKPVWGLRSAVPYSELAANAMLSQLRSALGDFLIAQ